MNEADQNTSVDDLESEESVNLAELRKKLELSNIQLLELTYNDEKFLRCIDEFNTNGIERVQNQQLKQALVYFSENEKILEYAASCGKTIDRSIIIATLHNQACVHQKLWDLQKSANYLEAIIYNINIYLQSLSDKKFDSSQVRPKQRTQLQTIASIAKKKQNFALYQLQFCAVNSQIRKHHISVESAYSAIKILKNTCKLTSLLLQKNQNHSWSFQNQYLIEHKKILDCLTQLEEDLQSKNYDVYLKEVRALMADKIQRSAPLQEQYGYLKSFSIGKLMQLTPIKISEIEEKPKIQEWIRYDNILIKALYLGVSYFTVGTQLRFISSQNCEEGSQEYKNSIEFKTSEVYHLYAILIILTYVPLDTIFLNHLITSFNNHYMTDIQKYSNLKGSSQKISIDIRNSKNMGVAGYSENQPNINELPQSSQLKLSSQQRYSQRQFPNNQKKLEPKLSKQKNQKSNSNRTKKTRIKNVEQITVIRKTSEYHEEQQQDSKEKDKMRNAKSPSSKGSSKSNKKFKSMFVKIKTQKQHEKQKEKVDFVNKTKSKTPKQETMGDQLKKKSVKNTKSKKKDKLSSIKINQVSKGKKKGSSNSTKKPTKIQCIYTVRNKQIQGEGSKQKKNKKSSMSRSKSHSKKKSMKGMNILAASGCHTRQKTNLIGTENKSHLQKYNNDLLNSPKSQDLEQAFKDRAKLVHSKTGEGDNGIWATNRMTIHESHTNFEKPKSKSKLKQKQMIKIKKITTKVKPLSSK